MERLFHLRERAIRDGLRDRVCRGPLDPDALLAELLVPRAIAGEPCRARVGRAGHAPTPGSGLDCLYCGFRIA